jgi:hypothetical protein
MAFNLGAFAGGLTQGGSNTYFKLGEAQRQEEELAMRKQEAAYQEEQRNQERELNKISALTLGAGDKRTVADQSTVNQAYEGADAPAATGYKEVAYTPQQQMADFKQRALSAGVPLQKVTAVSGAHRAEKYAEREELALGFTQQVMDDVKNNPTDLGAVFKKHFQEQYNEGKLPGLGDGKTAEVVPAATGGQSIVLKDGKGNVTKTMPLDLNTIQAMTQKWTGAMMASSSPASWWKSREEDLKSREVGAKEALVPSEIAKNKAVANQANAHASVYGNMLQTAKESKEAGKAMQPFLDEFAQMTPEDQAGAKGQAVLLKGATAGAQKSKDLAGIVSMLRKPDRAAVSAEQEKAAYTDLQGATTPEQIRAVKAKWPDVFGKSALDKAIEAREKGGAGSAATTAVDGRPLYNKSMSELQSMAKKPRGVSTAEANDAQAELEARKGEPRMSALPSN